MYRLLKARCVAINNNYTKTLQTNLQTSTTVCSFCRFSHPKITKSTISYLQHRHRTTTISTAVLDTHIPKKIKRKSKRYAELLEVSENETSNRKASIRNLNADQLSILVDQPDITLDKLHKLRARLSQINTQKIKQYEDPQMVHDLILLEKVEMRDFSKLRKLKINDERDDDSSIIEDLQASGISDHAGLIKNSSFLQSLEEDVHKDDIEEEAGQNLPEKITLDKRKKCSKLVPMEKEIAAKTKLAELIEKAKEDNLAHGLHAYIQVCLSSGMTTRAYNTLMYYRKYASRNKNAIKVRDVRLYNLLLHTYAASANMPKIKEILGIMREDSIKPSLQTYAAVFDGFGRLRKPEKEREFLDTIRLEMEENGVTFDDVVKIPKYVNDQRKQVTKTIKFLQPDFQPTESVPDYSYDCHLLGKINVMESRVKPSPAENLFTVPELQERLVEQLSHEVEGEVVVKSIEKIDKLKPSVALSRSIISDLEKSWTKIALKAFDRNMTALKNRERIPFAHSIALYPYLCVLEKDDYIKAIIRDIRRLADGSETFSPMLSWLHRDLGSRINEKYEISEKKRCGVMEKIEEVYLKYCDWYLNPKNAANSRVAWQTIAREAEKNGASLETGDALWPISIRLGVGKFLYDIILQDIKLDINCIKPNSKEKHYLPAFYTLFRSKGKRLKEEIKPHPILSKLYRESQPETLTFEASLLPSVCPPKPWSNVRSGGYIVAKSNIVRVPTNAIQQWQRLESAPPKQLWPALDSLNQLASIPWSVNNQLLDVVIEVFREGGSAKLNVPQPPSVLPPVPSLQPESSETERINISKARTEFRRRKSEMYSLWCDSLYRLSLANHFRDKIFWLPHNMDFRGRVYPIPPHLNHLGSDLARSLLVFGLGKPLGPNGLDWLKIHTINLTGFKKRDPISERLKYANDIMDKILDSAENPLNGEMWWSTSDEPWQTLAGCMEIARALKAEDPEKYVSRFPIHQDGSCNGLQHYAALGRDQIGAENVNLHPFETPQDVYSSVAAMVDTLREKDAADGHEIAKILKGYIKRKVIKQTVMTTVYGVTKFGARLQIARQLKDIDDFPQEFVWGASIYLVQKTFESLRTMFESAREIQDWFTECARVIAISCGRNVEWVTPLGLPVVQPYSKQENRRYKDIPDIIERPNTVKQKNAFPPNFIHSLDSSHMMLTSLHCEHDDLTFMSVHDCYWTHPCTVERMNKICREQFVALHSEPILEDLSKFLLQQYGCRGSDSRVNELMVDLSMSKLSYMLSQVPRKGTFELKGVLKSAYFFS